MVPPLLLIWATRAVQSLATSSRRLPFETLVKEKRPQRQDPFMVDPFLDFGQCVRIGDAGYLALKNVGNSDVIGQVRG